MLIDGGGLATSLDKRAARVVAVAVDEAACDAAERTRG
jgi:hypothetical protein